MHKLNNFLAASITSLLAFASHAALAETTINVHYAYPSLVKPVHETISNELTSRNPDIKVKFVAPSADYDKQMQLILRGAITGDLPDVVFVGTNWKRSVVERGLAVSVDNFIAQEAEWSTLGYGDGAMRLVEVDGKRYGLPFALSTPLMFYNVDLVRKAGGDPDNFPKHWDGVFDLAGKIATLEDGIEGISLPRSSGDWYFQSMVLTHGGEMISDDGKNVGFDSPAGLAALNIFDRAVKEGKMQDLKTSAARQNFAAGHQGITWNSTAQINKTHKAVGERFEFRTAPLPLPEGAAGGIIAAGGAVGMILTQDPEKQAAAWEYIKLASSDWGGSVVVQQTGYMTPNQNVSDPENPYYLGEFYAANPNFVVSIKQIPLIAEYFAYSGDNGLKINKVIFDGVADVVAQRATPQDSLTNISSEVRALLNE